MSTTREQSNQERRRVSEEKIVAGLIGCLAEKSLSEITMADVARQAGVAKGLAYNYFSSKEELFQSALDRRFRELDEVMRAVPASGGVGRLSALAHGLLEQILRDRDAFRLYFLLSLDSPAGSLRTEDRQKSIEHYLSQVDSVFRELGSQDPRADAYLFRSAALGICLRAVRGGSDEVARQAMARLVDWTAGSIKREGEGP